MAYTIEELDAAIRVADREGRREDVVRLAQARVQLLSQQKPQAKEPTLMDDIRGGLQTLGKGASLGFADEAAGLITAGLAEAKDILTPGNDGLAFGEVYEGARDAVRADQQGFAERNPKTAMGLEIAGALPTGGGGGVAAVRGVSKVAPGLLRGATGVAGRTAQFAGRNALLGAVPGAIYGAGAAQEGERLQGAEQGAAIGAVASPVLGGAAIAAAKTGKVLASPFFSVIRGKRLSADEAAKYEIVADAFDDMDMSAEMARQNIKQMGSGSSLVDAGGFANTKNGVPTGQMAAGTSLVDLGEDLAQTNQKSRQIVQGRVLERLMGQRERVSRLVNKVLNPSEKNPYDTLVDAVETVKKNADPLYEQARRTPISIDARIKKEGSISLRGLMENPTIKPILREAQERVAGDRRIPPEQKDELGFAVWNEAKKILGGRIGAAKRAGDNDMASRLSTIKKDLVENLDAQVPVYANARKLYGDAFELEEAAKWGEDVFTKIANKKISKEQIVNEFESFSTAAKHHARLGVAKVMQNMLDNSKSVLGELPAASLISQLYGSPAQRAVVNTLIKSPEQRRAFETALNAERQAHANANQMLRGSQTRRRGLGVEKQLGPVAKAVDAAGEFTLNVFYATTGNRWAAVKVAQSVANVLGSNKGNMSSRLRAELADTLTSQDEAVINKAIDEVEKMLGERNMPKRLKQARNQQMFKWLQQKDNANYLQRTLGSKEGLRAAIAAEQAMGGEDSLSQDIINAVNQ